MTTSLRQIVTRLTFPDGSTHKMGFDGGIQFHDLIARIVGQYFSSKVVSVPELGKPGLVSLRVSMFLRSLFVHFSLPSILLFFPVSPF